MSEYEFLRVNGVQYRLLRQGGPSEDITMFFHGFMGAASDWDVVTERLAPYTSCVAVDLLGHGKTDSPKDPARYGMDEATSDIAAILDHLGHESVQLVGYSMGGRLALAFALRYPTRVRRLVLESATPGLASLEDRASRRTADELRAKFLEEDGIRALVRQWENMPLFVSQRALPAAVLEKQRQTRLAQSPRGLSGSLRGMGTGAQPSFWGELGKLHVPTLLITGSLDGKFTDIAAKMAPRLPACLHDVCKGAGHNVHLEEPEWFAQEVLKHILE